MSVVSLRGAALTYPGPPPVDALRPCDLEIAVGEFLAIVGPSGAGKSTLLNILGLLDRPTSGSYELRGADTAKLPDAERTALRAEMIGFVFQSFHLIPYRSAQDNVMLAQLYQGVARKTRIAAARDALHRVGLSHRVGALPTQMSGGERQRVAIARAIVAEPALLLCDEPTGNLDSATADVVLDLICELNAAGITTVVITHNDSVARRTHRVVRIQDGELA